MRKDFGFCSESSGSHGGFCKEGGMCPESGAHWCPLAAVEGADHGGRQELWD